MPTILALSGAEAGGLLGIQGQRQPELQSETLS